MLPPEDRPAHPDTGASPEWVLRTFLEGLREPDTPSEEDGFASAYHLSAPAYRTDVGGFEGFVREVRSAFMSPLLRHETVRRGPLEVDDDLTEATQRVLVTGGGEEYVYGCELEQHGTGKYADCWLVRSVTLSMEELDTFPHLPTVEFDGAEIKCEPGDVLRDVLLGVDGLTPHNGRTDTLNCGGNSLCGTCAVEIVDGPEGDPTTERGSRESRRLSLPPFRGSDVPNLRLACRTEVTGDLRVRKHDGRLGSRRVDADGPWHEQFCDGETVRVDPAEYEVPASSD